MTDGGNTHPLTPHHSLTPSIVLTHMKFIVQSRRLLIVGFVQNIGELPVYEQG